MLRLSVIPGAIRTRHQKRMPIVSNSMRISQRSAESRDYEYRAFDLILRKFDPVDYTQWMTNMDIDGIMGTNRPQ